jgi:predicted nucleic acid-binding protein
MSERRPLVVIADTSVLINFLRIDRVSLLGGLSCDFLIADHVREEIADAYPEQQTRLAGAIDGGVLSVVSLTRQDEIEAFAALIGLGRLGEGECASIAFASTHGHAVGLDDRRAITEARRMNGAIEIVGTAELVVLMIKDGLLTVEEADAIKAEWESRHRFKLRFASFADVLS